MGDESMDVSSEEQLSVCAGWLHGSKLVEDFLWIVPEKETTAEAIIEYLCAF